MACVGHSEIGVYGKKLWSDVICPLGVLRCESKIAAENTRR